MTDERDNDVAIAHLTTDVEWIKKSIETHAERTAKNFEETQETLRALSAKLDDVQKGSDNWARAGGFLGTVLAILAHVGGNK